MEYKHDLEVHALPYNNPISKPTFQHGVGCGAQGEVITSETVLVVVVFPLGLAVTTTDGPRQDVVDTIVGGSGAGDSSSNGDSDGTSVRDHTTDSRSRQRRSSHGSVCKGKLIIECLRHFGSINQHGLGAVYT